jgi:predicted secreted Zn-dependent protease
MDPEVNPSNVMGQNDAPRRVPFALRVFIIFSSSVFCGAGFALMLWALPSSGPTKIARLIIEDTQEALNSIFTSPCNQNDSAPCGQERAQKIGKEPIAPIVKMVISEPTNDSPEPTPVPRPHIPEKKQETKAAPQQRPVINRATPSQKPIKVAPVFTKKIAEVAPQKPATKVAVAPPQPAVQKQAPAPAPIETRPPARSTHTCTRMNSYVPAGPISVDTGNPGLNLVIENPTYYTVYGSSLNEIRRQISACNPLGQFDAVTNWWYRYVYNYIQNSNGLCTVKDVTLALHITYLLPRWVDEGAPSSVSTQWNRYATNLTTHEHGHKDITVRLAQQTIAALQQFPETPCSEIVSAIDAFANQHLQQIGIQNKQYDAQTDFGATQGARFP